MYKFVGISAFITSFIILTASSYAAGYSDYSNCTSVYGGVYGGGQTCSQTETVVLDKTVQNPQTNAFVDNLNANDAKYGPGQTVPFQITLANTGDTTIGKLTVKDVFPKYIDNGKTQMFDVYELNPGEKRSFNVSGKVVAADELPNSNQVTCTTNQVMVSYNNKTVQDQAQLCIEKTVVSGQVISTTKGSLPVMPPPLVKTTPATGPEALPLIGLIPSGVLGYILRKKSA